MCSISGIISRRGVHDCATAVARMNVALRHRGPDDSGIVSIPNSAQNDVCLGNTRLSIIDITTAGHQPMHDEATGNWITYNGETYNFRELRHEIGDEFGRWNSNTDTEVVLRAYRKWGFAAFAKLRGMFALAIWDAAKNELLLARDRYGIKPLYYHQNNDSLIFASEVRALLASELVDRKLSRSGVASYLNFGSIQAPLTIVEGVRSLLPGQYMLVDEDFETRIGTFVENHTESNPPRDRHEAIARLRADLEESVRFHLVSDVPLGVFLSGGMDSSALVALMSRVTEEKPKTFSVIFEEEKFTEQSYSRAVAEKFGTEHCEIHLDEQRLFDMLPAALAALDQPTMDGTNTYVVSKAVKEAGVTVALSGLGGDELFAGYPSFNRSLRVAKMSPVTKGLLRAVSGVGSILLNGTNARKKFWQLFASPGTPSDVYRITRQLFSPSEIERLTLTSPPGPIKAGSPVTDPINAISHLELTGYMANTLLRDTDSMSMAHSLEVRVPFVDQEIIESVLALPGEWKLSDQEADTPKPMLADAMSDLLGRDFLRRPKMGFTLPLENWTQSRLRQEISNVLAAGAAAFDQHVALNTWQSFLKAPRAIGWTRPWSLYVLAKWCQLNNVTN
jgi:asparagine synthase (glutamine-hydrolysing)